MRRKAESILLISLRWRSRVRSSSAFRSAAARSAVGILAAFRFEPVHGLARAFYDIVLPVLQFAAEILALARVHKRFIIVGA